MGLRVRAFVSIAVATAMCVGSTQLSAAVLNVSGNALTSDTTVYSDGTSDNTGANPTNFSGQTQSHGVRRLLVKFDVSAIPSNATVQAVSLQMTIVRVSNISPADSTHTLHRLNNSWVQGSGLGGGAGGQIIAGAASWLYRQTPSLAWTAPGGDYVGAPSASTYVGFSTGNFTWSGAGLVSDVQGWVANSTTNFGWILIGDETVLQSAREFGSADGSAAQQPVLTVTYSVPSRVEDWVSY